MKTWVYVGLWGLGREILVNAISIYFTFSSLSDPQAWDKGEIVQFLGTKPQISQKQDFSGVCDTFYRMRNQISMKKSLVQKNLSFYPGHTQIAEISRILPIKAPSRLKKTFKKTFFHVIIKMSRT